MGSRQCGGPAWGGHPAKATYVVTRQQYMNRFRQQKDLPWAPEALGRGCVVFAVPGWRKGTGAQEPHGSLRPTHRTGETFVQPYSHRLPRHLRHLGCLQGCCCNWDVLLNFLKPGLLNGVADAVSMARIK